MMLSDLGARVNGKLLGSDIAVQAFCTDTRCLKSGDVFIALRGENFDGHNYIRLAQEKGAAAVVLEQEQSLSIPQLLVNDALQALGQAGAHNREQSTCVVIGITGSSGKTSVKGMLQSILSISANTLATEANYNNHIGVPLTLLRITDDYKYSVVEAGTSGIGEIAYLNELIKPDIAVVNNVMLAHGEGFGSEGAIAEEKAAIYKGVKVGVVNLMDDYASLFIDALKGKKIYGFALQDSDETYLQELESRGLQSDMLVSGQLLGSDPDGCYTFRIKYAGDKVEVALAVPGKHSVCNALAAAVCAVAVGVDLTVIAEGLASFSGVKGRMQRIESTCVEKLIDDSYNANPGSMRAAIDFLASQKNPILIVGDMGELGEAEVDEHIKLGAYAKNNGVMKLYAAGPLSKHTVDAFGKSAIWFESKERLLHFLEKEHLEDSTVLVKGSRYMHMESVIQFLKNMKGVDKC